MSVTIICIKWSYQHECSVNNATLNRFFSLHFVLPFVIAALALMHLITLHDSAGSGNPLGVSGNYDRLAFSPYFVFKDLITIFIFILILSIFVFFMPNFLGDSENYVMANPMQTPPAIVPEWYLLPFYAILRSIPNKLLGVIAMFSAILILLAMPFTDLSKFRGLQFRPLSKAAFFIFVANFLILMQLGAKHVEFPFIEFGQISTVIYFAHFLIIVPLISLLENTLMDIAGKDIIPSYILDMRDMRHSLSIHKSSCIITTIFSVISYIIYTVYNSFGYLKKNAYCDAPRPWGLYFQDSGSPQMEGLVELHDNILFYLVIILFSVGWILVSIARIYSNLEFPISHQNVSHGTLIELIWTITPALILIFIAFPSFKLLYLMDEVSDPSMAVLAEGFEKRGLKLHIINKIKDTKTIGEKINTLVLRFAQIKNTSLSCCLHCSISNARYNINKHPNIFKCHTFNKSFHTKVKASNRIGPHNLDVISILIGSLLGDCYANAKTIEGTRFSYRQSENNKDYLFWLYDFYHSRGYCSNLKPRMYTRVLKNEKYNSTIKYYGYEFNTYTFRSLNWLHVMFYKKGKKRISASLEKYMTPLALAIWIMDDGGWVKPRIRIATNNFKINEVILLVNILKKLFDLNCTVQNINIPNRYSLYIKTESIPRLRYLILPYVIPSMQYKLGL